MPPMATAMAPMQAYLRGDVSVSGDPRVRQRASTNPGGSLLKSLKSSELISPRGPEFLRNHVISLIGVAVSDGNRWARRGRRTA